MKRFEFHITVRVSMNDDRPDFDQDEKEYLTQRMKDMLTEGLTSEFDSEQPGDDVQVKSVLVTGITRMKE